LHIYFLLEGQKRIVVFLLMLLLSKCCLSIAVLQTAKAYNALFCSWFGNTIYSRETSTTTTLSYSNTLFEMHVFCPLVFP